jgi:zinc protease
MNAHIKHTSHAARVQQIVSPRGICAWLVEDYAVPLVAMDFAFKGGSAQDPEDKQGLATLLSSMLDEGAGDLDDQAFHTALDDKAISLSFDSSQDNFTGHLKTLSRHVGTAFDLLHLAINAPQLAQKPLERVRAQMMAGLKSEANDPDAMAGRVWRATAFPQHPYGRPLRGTLETLPNIQRADLIAMRNSIFARSTLKIAVVGAIDAKQLGLLLDHVFADLPQTSTLNPIASIICQGLSTCSVCDLDVPQSTIRFGRKGLPRHDPDFMTAMVVNHILGGGVFTARLFAEVREKRGLAYSVHSNLSNYDQTDVFMGSTSTKNERAAESLDVIQEQIRLLSNEGPSAEELEKAKKFLIGSYALRFDTSTKISRHLLGLQIEHYDLAFLDHRNALIEAITLEEAKRVANRLLGDGSLLVAIAGRPEGIRQYSN